MPYTSIPNVNFGDTWSASSHNTLLANAAAAFDSPTAYSVLVYGTTDTIKGIALSAGQYLKGVSSTDPAGAYPPPIELFPAMGANVPVTGSAAALEYSESSTTDTWKPTVMQLRFDSTDSEARLWSFYLGNAIGTPTLKIGYKMASNNTSKSVKFDAYVSAVSDADGTVSAKSFSTVNTVTVTCPDTADVFDVVTITLSNMDSATEGDRVTLLLARDPAVASDADGDAIVQFVAFTYG